MWTKIGRYFITERLIFTKPFKEQLVKITQSKVIYPDKVQGLIYQGFKDKFDENIFNKQELVYSAKSQILTFYFPQELGERSLVFTRTDKSKILWFVDVEVYEQPITPLQINNESQLAQSLGDYLLLNFQDFKTSMEFNLIPTNNSAELKSGFLAQLLIPANPNRAALRIRAGGSPVFIWADTLDENGQPLILLDEIQKGQSVTLPSAADGIYKGAIYAHVAKKVRVDWTEYSYPQISQEIL